MNVTHVMIELEKMVSDGKYGRERAVVQYAVDLDQDESVEQATTALLHRARAHLAAELRSSESITVRRAINPPPRLCGECQQPLSDDEDYRHPVCDEIVEARRKREREEAEERYRQQQAEWEARRNAQPELAAVGAQSHNGDDDPEEDDQGDDEDEPL